MIETIRREYPLSLVVRETGPAEFSLEGLAVPYGTPTPISDGLGNYTETFARGAFDPAAVEGLPLMYRHGEPVGVIRRAWESERGLMIAAQLSDTALGRDARTLARDGALRGLSVSADVNLTDGTWAQDGSSVTWNSAHAREVSLTPFPAYPDAQLTTIRERTTMLETPTIDEGQVSILVREQLAATTEPLTTEISELREQVATLAREMAAGRPGHVYTNAREFHADLWNGRRDADASARLQRALGVATMAANPGLDPQNVLSTIFGDIRHGRPTAEVVGIGPLPALGTTVDVPTITQDPSTADYPAENGAVAGQNFTVAFTNATVFTEAGGSEVPQLYIDRSSPDGLALLTSRYAEVYARRFNARVVTQLATAAQTAAFPTGAWSTAAIGKTLADAAGQIIAGVGGTPDYVTLAYDLYFPLALVSGVGYPLAGNQPGNASLRAMSFQAFGLTFTLDPLLAAGTGYIGSREAFMVLESPGAPFNLEAPVPSKLARDTMVYGYGAIVVNDMTGVVKLSKTP